MLDQQVLEEIYTIAEKVGAHQVLTEREQAMYDDILEDAGYYQAFCLYTAMIDFPTFYEQSVSREKQPVKERQKEKIQEIEKINVKDYLNQLELKNIKTHLKLFINVKNVEKNIKMS